ncbi:hypothetical protein JHN49_43210 [Streptomyces sp. MBT57]|nr:hypothetical protein [Streptomyces sp. MBT57]
MNPPTPGCASDGPGVLRFGMPQPDRAPVSLYEARRQYGRAAGLAATVWRASARQHLAAWAAVTAPEFARIALRAADDGLRAVIAEDLAHLPHPLPAGLAPSVHLAEALTDPDGRDAADRARRDMWDMCQWVMGGCPYELVTRS